MASLDRIYVAQIALQAPECIAPYRAYDFAMVATTMRDSEEKLSMRQYSPKPDVCPKTFEEQVYSALLELGDTCFDIGANVGRVAVYLAKIVGSHGSVVAFEPVQPIYQSLCKLIQDDRDEKAPIITVAVGLSDSIGTSSISVPSGDFERASMADSHRWKEIQAADVISQVEGDFTTLDALLVQARFPPPFFMKVDVEGAELLILTGGEEAFDGGFRPLMLMELFAPWERAFDYGPWDVLSRLSDLEYRFLFMCPAGLVEHVPSRLFPFPSDYAQGYNVVAFVPRLHNARVERLRHLRQGGVGPILPMPPAPIPNLVG